MCLDKPVPAAFIGDMLEIVDNIDEQAGHADAARTLAEQLFRRLSDAIVSGELPPGSKLSEPVLARQYGVSRGPLREALNRLQERHLITRTANQGPRIVKPSAGALAELF